MKDGLYMPPRTLGAVQLPGSVQIPGYPTAATVLAPQAPGGTVLTPRLAPDERAQYQFTCTTIVIHPQQKVIVKIYGTGPEAFVRISMSKIPINLYEQGGKVPINLYEGIYIYNTWGKLASLNDPEIMMGLWFAAAHPEGVSVPQVVRVSDCTDLRGGGWKAGAPLPQLIPGTPVPGTDCSRRPVLLLPGIPINFKFIFKNDGLHLQIILSNRFLVVDLRWIDVVENTDPMIVNYIQDISGVNVPKLPTAPITIDGPVLLWVCGKGAIKFTKAPQNYYAPWNESGTTA
jgi:hypothetical protein